MSIFGFRYDIVLSMSNSNIASLSRLIVQRQNIKFPTQNSIHCESKKHPTILLSVTSPNVDRYIYSASKILQMYA